MTTVFDALSDKTRRGILSRLRLAGPQSVSDLTADLPMTRQAVTKHLDLLHEAGLIHIRWEGRVRLHELDGRPLKEVEDWLAPYSAFWDETLERLEKHLEDNP